MLHINHLRLESHLNIQVKIAQKIRKNERNAVHDNFPEKIHPTTEENGSNLMTFTEMQVIQYVLQIKKKAIN